MATTAPAQGRTQDPRGSNLDVDWLLHGKREFVSPQSKDNAGNQRQSTQTPPPLEQRTEPTPRQAPTEPPSTPIQSQSSQQGPQRPQPVYNSTSNATPTSPSTPQSPANQTHSPRPTLDDSKKSGKSGKKDGRRSSWFSSLGHKISGGSSTSSRTSSIDSTAARHAVQSPKLEFQDPFGKNIPQSGQQGQQQPETIVHHVPQGQRRPSVLVAAGTETKLDHPGFLTSALRRLSSGSAVTLGKGAGSTNTTVARRVMNIDQNRERSKILEFDQNKLRRVAFCVDVEIAGIASQEDEEGYGPLTPIGHPATSNASKPTDGPGSKRPVSMSAAKYKDKGEGAALKDPVNAEDEKEQHGKTRIDAREQAKQMQKDTITSLEAELPRGDGPDQDLAAEKSVSRKKEKKKRSEAERKERRERKRRHAEMNGLVPLELTREDDDSDSSSTNTLGGTSTPKNGDKPTTNPLRIYKRCCQLRETTALSIIKDQISKPDATLAESPGTVASVDLRGTKMSLQDIVTFGDWLAVVPVRRLILDDCGLGDEAIRVILSGLLGCKTPEQARQNRKLPRSSTGKSGQEQLGVIERLSLKNNPAITSIGWKHIALFIHLSRSLYAIDLTGIPYPKSPGDLSRIHTENSTNSPATGGANRISGDTGSLVARAIHERFGERLEELILSGCSLSTSHISELIDAAIFCKIRRLGLAGNHLSNEAMAHVVRYAVSDVCEGLDLGSNDLHDNSHLLSQVIHEKNPMFALSLADCNLTADDLARIMPKLCEMKNFKFIDLSRNHQLFEGQSNAVQLLRKCLPKMRALKRIHLADVGLTPDHIIALSDVFPDCPALAHINILENAPLVQMMNSSKISAQEEAAAFLASIMTATRVSQTLVAVELEVPGVESSEVVKALSQQVAAYSLRNMERSALNDIGVESKSVPDKDAPEVLLHLVGYMDGYPENHDRDDPAPDEDYLIASTGLVRALSVCLGNQEASRNASRTITPTASGTVTPRQGPLRPNSQKKKPKDVSLELCEAARKIRMRLRPALVKEDKAGNQEAYRRLWYLDQTLEGMIQRFEDEYPDSRPAVSQSPPDLEIASPPDSPNLSRISTIQDSNGRRVRDSMSPDFDTINTKLSPSSSSTSLASRALMHEEGRMLRFGHTMKRDLLKPVGMDDHAYGTSTRDAPEAPHLAALRSKLAGLSGEEVRQRVEADGADNVVKELEINAEDLRLMAIENPVGFEALSNCALMDEVRRMGPRTSMREEQPTIPGSFNAQVTS